MKIEIIGNFKSIKNEEIVFLIDEITDKIKMPAEKSIEIVSVTNDEIRSLNKVHRNKDEVTDVLSFPIGETVGKESILGTIAISEDYSLENHETVDQLIKHGFLHLVGHDHESKPEEWLKAANIINHKMY